MSEIATLPNVCALSAPLTRALVADAAVLRLGQQRLANGTRCIDAGIATRGGLEAGRRIAEICLGGLGRVALRAGTRFAGWPWSIDVHTADPVLACLASQYAGWSLHHGSFRAMGSGPGRAAGSREELFGELDYRVQAEEVVLVLEVDAPPPVELAQQVADMCGIPGSALTLVLTPTTSLAGSVQVVARVLEVALHKVHALGFPLSQVVDGAGTAPLCPPGRDFLTAMGRTNDAILFGGEVHLYVDCGDDEAADLAQRLPSSASRDYGRPFAEVFKACEYDFYRIDPHLFSPARVLVTALATGRTHVGGRLDEPLLDRSFG